MPVPTSLKWRSSGLRTSGSAKCLSRSSTRKMGFPKSDLRAFLEQRIAKFKIPARFIFSPEPLPKLGTGKIDRPSLKAQYAR